jgi:hypothetical protein
VAALLARYKQPTGLFVSGLGLQSQVGEDLLDRRRFRDLGNKLPRSLANAGQVM